MTGTFAIFDAAINETKGAPVASAAAPDIWAVTGNTIHITGTTAIISFPAAPQPGVWRRLIFDDAVTLTHSANFVVQGNTNYTTAPNDIVWVFADTTTKFYLCIQRANGKPIAPTVPVLQTFTANGTWTKPLGVTHIRVRVVGGGGGGGGNYGGGGGGGGYSEKIIDVSGVSSVAVTVGAAGGSEASGGTSSFGTHCSATGGGGGSNAGNGGTSGVGTDGDINVRGGAGDRGFGTSIPGGYAGRGGDSVLGGGGGGNNGTGGEGAGGNYGGGGAGGSVGSFGGGPGIVIVEEFK